MKAFPRTVVGGLSVSRMIIGTNWFVGYSHRSPAHDHYIKEHVNDPKVLAGILEVYFRAGVDTIMGILTEDHAVLTAITEAEQRTGVQCIKISTPILDVADSDKARGEAARQLDRAMEIGSSICMPHHSSVDLLMDRGIRRIRRIEDYLQMIRERGMIPGLSAHMPETVVFADETGVDVETYIQIYNAAGFLMQLEVEWVHRIIQDAKKPVMTIKPMAAGRVTPFVGLNFAWNTIRNQDMVTVGTMSPREAAEVIEISWAALERRSPVIGRRDTPSKQNVDSK